MSISMKALILICSISLVSGCMSVDISDKNFIHPDSKTAYQAKKKFDVTTLQATLSNATLQELSIDTDDGAILKGIQIGQANAKTSVLYFGGNNFHIDSQAQHVIARIGQCASNISIFDYRGYGRSNGAPNITNMQADALKIYDQVREKTTGKLVVHGLSLGSFMAAHVARNRSIDGLILEATATNAQDWAYATTPWYVRPFISFNFDPALGNISNVDAAKAHLAPALVITGEKDVTTPPALGKKVFEAFTNPSKQLLEIKNTGHNGLLSSPQTFPTYCDFLK